MMSAIRILLVGLWACVIYGFSSQPLERQSLRPWLENVLSKERMERYFGWVSFHYAGHEISVGVLGAAAFAEFFIRKAAHVTEYAILGALLLMLLASLIRKQRVLIPCCICCCLLFAASDEYHQSFVMDRTPLIQDVLLDTAGASLGIGIALLFLKLTGILVRVVRGRKENFG